MNDWLDTQWLPLLLGFVVGAALVWCLLIQRVVTVENENHRLRVENARHRYRRELRDRRKTVIPIKDPKG